MDKEGLRISAQRANKEGYGSGKEQNWEKEADGSTVITLTFGDFEVRDKFWGGEPFGGCEVISFQGKPVWMMVYYGSVARGQDSERIYATLWKALSKAPDDMPVRGPVELEDGELTYENGWSGSMEDFSGNESIVNEKGRTVYSARYVGGLVDQGKE